MVGTLFFLRIVEDDLQGFQITVNIAENGKFHNATNCMANSRVTGGLSSRFSAKRAGISVEPQNR